MNNGFYTNLDTNFEQACKLCETSFSHEELLNMLISGNIPQKQIAALYFDDIKNENDVEILISNLTGCDGKIREAVAMRINYFINKKNETKKFFAQEKYASAFANATIDINGNISRYIIDTVKGLKFNNDFAKLYTNYILEITQSALDELDKFIFRDKKYLINKQLFKLYWCLETLNNFQEFVNHSLLEHILNKCSDVKEYTIREKTAQIVISSGKFPALAKKLKNDENYYVRRLFLHHN